MGNDNNKATTINIMNGALEMQMCLESQVCFFLPFFYYTNNYLHLDRLHIITSPPYNGCQQ